jgi:hypothetical protein
MYETIQMPCALLYVLPHIIVDFHVKDIGYEIERILVVLHFRVKASQIEAVGKVVFVDFAKVFVSSCCDELFATSDVSGCLRSSGLQRARLGTLFGSSLAAF